MDKGFKWLQLGPGYVGIMKCGIAFAFITRYGLGYTVRFGMVESQYLLTSLEDAQAEAIVIARRVLGDCLREL